MNTIEEVCLKLCEEIFCTSSITDKTVLNYSVNILPENGKTVEVTLVTKDDEYYFLFDLPEEGIYVESDSHLIHCSKCALENKYKVRSINIKGYNEVEFGKVDLEYLKTILGILAEDHARCIEENNSEKKYYKNVLFSSLDEIQEPLLDTLHRIIQEDDGGNIDFNKLEEGINAIEKSYETALRSNEEYVYVYGNLLQKKLFVKNTDKNGLCFKILNIRTEQNCPLVYDLLMTIYAYSDQNMRQHSFDELLDHYYESLTNLLHKVSLDITKCLPQTAFKRQIHQFNSYVKLNILKQICHGFSKDGNQPNIKTSRESVKHYETNIWPSLLELNECILYPNLSREDCYTILRNKIGTSAYRLLSYKLIPLEEREGYLGDYFKLKIEIEHQNETKLLHFFAKYLPTYNEMAKELALDSFNKEEFYYRKFIPELNTLGLGDITDFLPSCYFSRTNEVLVFEDMSAKNYRSFPVSIPYTYEMLLLTIKQVAKVHACSLLYEEMLTEKTVEVVRLDLKFPKYVEEKTVRNTKETLVKKTFDCAIRTFLDMLSVFPDIPKKFSMDEFKKRGKDVFDLCFEKVKKSKRFRNVLCQGDCWSSNILFKTDVDNLPIDCCLVDYQLTRYCPPAHDIYYLLFMATTKETRNKFESKLLQEYYLELSNILQKYNVDLQQIYSYQEYLDCCNYMKSQGLCHAIIILQFVLFPQEKLKDVFQDNEQVVRLFYENRDLFIEELRNEGSYRQRMMELAEALYEICERPGL